jgi:UDP-N-acetylglucosamine 2-epimerase (non-hydrolysing)
VARLLEGHAGIRLIEPLRYEEFIHLMSQCYLILTDSGGIQEEATALGKPTLIMRNTTERPEAVSCGTALLVGTCTDTILQAAERLLRDHVAYGSMSRVGSPFGDGHSSARITKILTEHLFQAKPDSAKEDATSTALRGRLLIATQSVSAPSPNPDRQLPG